MLWQISYERQVSPDSHVLREECSKIDVLIRKACHPLITPQFLNKQDCLIKIVHSHLSEKELKKGSLQTTLLHARFRSTWMWARIAPSVYDKTKGENTFTFGEAITFARFYLISAKCIGTYGGTLYLAHCRAHCLNTALGMPSPTEAYTSRAGCRKWLSPLSERSRI